MKNLFIFCVGSAGYGLLEILWRGYTHWTMLLVGGLCFFVIYKLFNRYSHNSPIIKGICGSLVITTIELLSGIVINILLGWGVWDYSSVKFNILGQVCLLYSFLWFLVSLALIYVCTKVKKLTEFLTMENVD